MSKSPCTSARQPQKTSNGTSQDFRLFFPGSNRVLTKGEPCAALLGYLLSQGPISPKHRSETARCSMGVLRKAFCPSRGAWHRLKRPVAPVQGVEIHPQHRHQEERLLGCSVRTLPAALFSAGLRSPRVVVPSGFLLSNSH